MGKILFMEKPEWVSWEDICECIHASHQTNKKWGFEMLNSRITASELSERLKGGKCFVALDNQKVVGTVSLKILKNNKKWWAKGIVSYHCYDAILPSYRGTDVYLGLKQIRDKYDKDMGIQMIQCNTAEHNKTIIKINEKTGYKRVQFAPVGNGGNYYSVTMVKWIDKCPYSDRFINLMYNLTKFVSKTFFTPDFRFRFWFK